MRRGTFAVVAAVLLASPAQASPERVRFLEGPSASKLTAEQLNEEFKPFLAPGAVDGRAVIGAPPAKDSAEDKDDVTLSRNANTGTNAARWKIAADDDASVYPRFEEAFGMPIDRAHLPRLVRLLNRVTADVWVVTNDTKKFYSRPRPYQRFQMKRVCGEASAPKPEASPTMGSSYPSGHASLSWAVVQVLAEIAPAKGGPLISRGIAYGDSRVICGQHFPRDVQAGQMLAAAVFTKLAEDPAFRRELACVKAELRGVLAGEKAEDMAACS